MNLCRSGLRAAAVLMPILGLTWVVGVFAIDSLSVPLAYIFTILNSLQVLLKVNTLVAFSYTSTYVNRVCLC